MPTRDEHRRLILGLSDERDQWQRLLDEAWRAGYAAASLAHADDYARGLVDGMAGRKHAEHELVELGELELLRWGPAGPAHFGCPRPGDYPGRGPAK